MDNNIIIMYLHWALLLFMFEDKTAIIEYCILLPLLISCYLYEYSLLTILLTIGYKHCLS